MFQQIISETTSSLFSSIFQSQERSSPQHRPERPIAFADHDISRSHSLQDACASVEETTPVPPRRVKSLSDLDHMDRNSEPAFYRAWKDKQRKSKKYAFVRVLQTIKEKQQLQQQQEQVSLLRIAVSYRAIKQRE
jgi:hypothetical protein